jgi:pimeloyl-ACP methyl ester carboxylesterase
VAIPRAARSRGCVIWQDGQGSKHNASDAWQGFASLGLTTVSIQFRRSRSDRMRGTVADLRSGLDYLEKQPYCQRNVAYAGVGLGGIVGTVLAAEDARIRAAVLASTPATFRVSSLDPVRFIGRISPRPVLVLSGLDDRAIPRSNARRLQAAARPPKTIVNYRGGHDPTAGPAASKNGQAVASFLLRRVVEPTYGISGSGDGTFTQP